MRDVCVGGVAQMLRNPNAALAAYAPRNPALAPVPTYPLTLRQGDAEDRIKLKAREEAEERAKAREERQDGAMGEVEAMARMVRAPAWWRRRRCALGGHCCRFSVAVVAAGTPQGSRQRGAVQAAGIVSGGRVCRVR